MLFNEVWLSSVMYLALLGHLSGSMVRTIQICIVSKEYNGFTSSLIYTHLTHVTSYFGVSGELIFVIHVSFIHLSTLGVLYLKMDVRLKSQIYKFICTS